LSPRILVIDDEPQIRRFLRTILEGAGWQVSEVSEGNLGLGEIVRNRPDVVVLDLGLPDVPGIEVLRRMREWTGVPVLVLSVSSGSADKIGALEAGADDYLTKPFREAELLARIRALLRHKEGTSRPSQISFGPIVINLINHVVQKNNQEVKLTETEFALLRFLAINNGKVMTQSQILRALWGPNAENHTQYIRVYVSRLRQKLEDDPSHPVYLMTESGLGYRINTPEIEDV
jgi:two-component system KDP operon response regulator KdpE